MAAVEETELSPYSPRQIYRLVADVARYPEFLPWCDRARILQGGEGDIWTPGGQQLAELTIQFKPFRDSYVSRVTFTPPKDEHSPCEVLAQSERGIFRHLTNRWQLTPTENGGCRIDFTVDFHFRSAILDKLLGGVFQLASQKLATAFRERAEAMYGHLPGGKD